MTVCVCAALLASCGQQSAEYKKLKAENDSLRIENTKSTEELNEMLSTLNDIEADIQSIRDAENYITIQRQSGGELSQTRREKIKQNMQLISETLKKNRAQISELEEKLKKSGIQSDALRKTVQRLSSELNEKTKMIVALQEDLAKKDVRIQELDEMVSSLNEDVENLSTTAAAQSEKINEQDKALHTAYYCFGTTKELKDQKILSGGGLFSKSKVLQDGFNKDYFISIDIREVKEIPLFAKKAKLRSNHPEGSYEFIEDEDGNLALIIKDENTTSSLISTIPFGIPVTTIGNASKSCMPIIISIGIMPPLRHSTIFICRTISTCGPNTGMARSIARRSSSSASCMFCVRLASRAGKPRSTLIAISSSAPPPRAG